MPPSTDTEAAPRRRSRPMPQGIDPLAKALIDVIDDQHDGLIGEVRSFRKLAWAGMGGVFVLLLVLILSLGETRGVDSTKIIDNTTRVMEAAQVHPDAAKVAADEDATEAPVIVTPAPAPDSPADGLDGG